MNAPDMAYVAIHDCGKVVAASAYWSDRPKTKTRSMAAARNWERKEGWEVVEVEPQFVHDVGWCDCFRRKPETSATEEVPA